MVIFSATVAEGTDYTFAALGKLADLKTSLLQDDNSAPAAGSAKKHAAQHAALIAAAVGDGGQDAGDGEPGGGR